MIKNVLYLSVAFFTFSIYAQEKPTNQDLLNKKKDSQKEILIKKEVGDNGNDTLTTSKLKEDTSIKRLKPKNDFLLERNR